ncbi:MAG: IS200/IS605 family transposase [Sphingobacteriales bacterium]|nr:IS200/IS605 family transposase [Sphingobacteriales bacterium]
MSSYRQIYYHIVFGTKFREPAIREDREESLYKYLWGIVNKKQCRLYQVNSMPDHIHLLTDLHPSVSLSNFIKDIKVSSSFWLKASGNFPLFKGWQDGYGAFTCGDRDRDNIIAYIRNQKVHHKKEAFRDEYKRLLLEQRIEFDEKYLF